MKIQTTIYTKATLLHRFRLRFTIQFNFADLFGLNGNLMHSKTTQLKFLS